MRECSLAVGAGAAVVLGACPAGPGRGLHGNGMRAVLLALARPRLAERSAGCKPFIVVQQQQSSALVFVVEHAAAIAPFR